MATHSVSFIQENLTPPIYSVGQASQLTPPVDMAPKYWVFPRIEYATYLPRHAGYIARPTLSSARGPMERGGCRARIYATGSKRFIRLQDEQWWQDLERDRHKYVYSFWKFWDENSILSSWSNVLVQYASGRGTQYLALSAGHNQGHQCYRHRHTRRGQDGR